MSLKLTVYINDQSAVEYDRDKPLEDRQMEFLKKMDADMDRGIKMGGELFEQPDAVQRAKFIAMNLINALQQDNEAVIAASCAYLASRQPELMEIRAKDEAGTVVIDLISDQGQPVGFSPTIN